jgi:hypothetical protein
MIRASLHACSSASSGCSVARSCAYPLQSLGLLAFLQGLATHVAFLSSDLSNSNIAGSGGMQSAIRLNAVDPSARVCNGRFEGGSRPSNGMLNVMMNGRN